MTDITAAGATSYADTTVADGGLYQYQVSALSGDGLGDNPSSPTDTLAVPLAAPTQLSATANGAGEIDLSWTNPSVNATGYTVFRSATGTSNFVDIAHLVYADQTEYQDTGLAAGTTYDYQVQATNGDSAQASDPANLTTSTGPAASVSGDSTVPQGTAYTLDTAVVYAGSTDPVSSWDMDWGDGTTATLSGDPASMTHLYPQPGIYTA